MTRTKKVVWFEGMTLDPHHFQQLDRYHQFDIEFRIRAIAEHEWGLVSLSIDEDSLTNGQFKLLECRGILPDGLTFQLPDIDPLPKALSIDSDTFGPTVGRIGVYLTIPAERLRFSNCLLSGEEQGRETRFTLENINIEDDNTGKDDREIGLAKKNFQLKFEKDLLDDHTVIQIASVARNTSGEFALDDNYAPTILAIGASGYLMKLLRTLLENLSTERDGKWQTRPLPSGRNEFTPSDAHLLSYLNTLNYFIPLLDHEFKQKKCHPVVLYKLFLTLAGQLTVYSASNAIHPRDFPSYDHKNLTVCFNKIEKIVRGLLRIETPDTYETIQLEKHGESLYMCELNDSHLDVGTALMLMIHGNNEVPVNKITSDLPHNIKITDKKKIQLVAGSAARGLSISYLARPPVGFPNQPDIHYFQLEKTGEFWSSISQNQDLAFLLTGQFKNLQVELVSVTLKH